MVYRSVTNGSTSISGRIKNKAVSFTNTFDAEKSIENGAEMVTNEAKYPIKRVLKSGQKKLRLESELETGKQIRSMVKGKKER